MDQLSENYQEKSLIEKKFGFFVILGTFLLIAAQTGYYYYIFKQLTDWQTRDNFGSFIGGIGSMMSGIISAISFGAIAYALVLQKRALESQMTALTEQKQTQIEQSLILTRAENLNAKTILLKTYIDKIEFLDKKGGDFSDYKRKMDEIIIEIEKLTASSATENAKELK